jgi:hypothetical protein
LCLADTTLKCGLVHWWKFVAIAPGSCTSNVNEYDPPGIGHNRRYRFKPAIRTGRLL